MGQNVRDAWEKAAACEAHAKATDDKKLQVKFRKLRDSWVRIGNDAQFADDVDANASRLQVIDQKIEADSVPNRPQTTAEDSRRNQDSG